jgi:hypothetical protein
MEIMETQKKTTKYVCVYCDFYSSSKKDFNKHILTVKHKNKTNKNEENKTPNFNCKCGRTFFTNAGMWKHQKKCSTTEIIISNEKEISATLIIELVKQNQEFKQLLIEQNAKIIELTSKPNTNITNTNSHNKTKFNLNFFLNEKCKDALNITDFVNSLKLQTKDLENTGKNGFVEGISNIIIRGLKELDVYKRPIHCSDAKRETMYVKDKNIWEKEKDEKAKIHKTIRQIAHKNTLQIPKWINEHPKCEDYYSKDNDQYLHIVSESMGGIDDEETNKYYNKIIKNVSKEMIIDEDK